MMIFYEDVLETMLVYLAVFFLARVFYRHTLGAENSSCSLPPAIRSFPIVGSIVFLSRYEDLHKWFLDKSDSLGYIIGFYAGQR